MNKPKPFCVQFRLRHDPKSSYRQVVLMVRTAGEPRYTVCNTGICTEQVKWQPYVRIKRHPSVKRVPTIEARLDAIYELIHAMHKAKSGESSPVSGRMLVDQFNGLWNGTGGQAHA